MMRALRLDYHAGHATITVGTVLLVSGALLVTVALLEYSALRATVSAWEAKIAEVRKAAKRGDTGAPRTARDQEAVTQEVKAAQAVLQRLSLPWDDLFGAFESVRANGVALLAVEPDPGKGTVKLTAEAKSDAEMLDYVARLQAVEMLANVTLAGHQIKQGDPLRVLRFAVVASWVKQP